MRKDAQLNLERVLAAAKAIFVERGPSASMEEIAQQAGVGVGTLYRRFGSRGGLVEALYEDAVSQVREQAAALEQHRDAWEALARWCAAYVEVLLTKRSILSELAPLTERDPGLFDRQRGSAIATLDPLLRRAQASGQARKNVEALDILTLLNTVIRGSAASDRLLDIVLAGVRSQEDHGG